jgi:hypothetical protein
MRLATGMTRSSRQPTVELGWDSSTVKRCSELLRAPGCLARSNHLARGRSRCATPGETVLHPVQRTLDDGRDTKSPPVVRP